MLHFASRVIYIYLKNKHEPFCTFLADGDSGDATRPNGGMSFKYCSFDVGRINVLTTENNQLFPSADDKDFTVIDKPEVARQDLTFRLTVPDMTAYASSGNLNLADHPCRTDTSRIVEDADAGPQGRRPETGYMHGLFISGWARVPYLAEKVEWSLRPLTA